MVGGSYGGISVANQLKRKTPKRYEEWAKGLWRELFG
jgi:hypothetical protein